MTKGLYEKLYHRTGPIGVMLPIFSIFFYFGDDKGAMRKIICQRRTNRGDVAQFFHFFYFGDDKGAMRKLYARTGPIGILLLVFLSLGKEDFVANF